MKATKKEKSQKKPTEDSLAKRRTEDAKIFSPENMLRALNEGVQRAFQHPRRRPSRTTTSYNWRISTMSISQKILFSCLLATGGFFTASVFANEQGSDELKDAIKDSRLGWYYKAPLKTMSTWSSCLLRDTRCILWWNYARLGEVDTGMPTEQDEMLAATAGCALLEGIKELDNWLTGGNAISVVAQQEMDAHGCSEEVVEQLCPCWTDDELIEYTDAMWNGHPGDLTGLLGLPRTCTTGPEPSIEFTGEIPVNDVHEEFVRVFKPVSGSPSCDWKNGNEGDNEDISLEVFAQCKFEIAVRIAYIEFLDPEGDCDVTEPP